MSLSEDLTWRGLIKDKTFSDINWLNEPKTFYHGVDCSSDSLTIGNLAALLLAKRMVKAGWKGIILVGGATSLVGDPGGKSKERELKDKAEINKNVSAIKTQIEKLFEGDSVVIVNNADWFGSINYLDFLRDVGKHYSMTELTQRDYITERMGAGGSGISYAEFSYTLIQGYDFWYLHKNNGAVLQIGGSDQWGNMLSGLPLIRLKENTEAHVMTMPLVVDKNTGTKFGKSEEGAIWLDAVKTPPTQFYQFWINVSDDVVEEFLKIFTFLSHAEIQQALTDHKKDPSARSAQKLLAENVTVLVHGSKSGQGASEVAKYLTGQADISKATNKELESIKAEIGLITALPGDPIAGLLSATRLASSGTEARRLLASGAVYINGQKVDRDKVIEADFVDGRFLLRRGKAYKDSVLVEYHK